MRGKQSVTSGVGRLDQLLGGLFIGDNVVWHDDAGSLAWIFCLKFLESSEKERKPIIYVSFDRSPKTVIEKLGALADHPDLTLIDCFTNGKGASSPIFLKFYDEEAPRFACGLIRVDDPRNPDQVNEAIYDLQAGLTGDVRLVFDSLTGMEELWGGEERLIRYYAHACPRLYELETVAYWIMEKNAHTPRLKAQITQIAQVVIELSIKRGTTSLMILKAEKREMEKLRRPFPYWHKGAEVNFDEERRMPGGLELGRRIKELRSRKGLSQTELARLVGVTPSTISQVENNLIYPSLPALFKMAEVLLVDVASFFPDTAGLKHRPVFTASDAVEVRLHALPEDVAFARSLTPIDLEGKVESFMIELAPNRTVPGHFFIHKGEEFGYVMAGRAEMKLESGTYILGPGDVVYLRTEAPLQWKNAESQTARLLWLKIR
ncbi:MAG: helix-turn-helix domain-containing protein [Proteobacteria bacterium]|nr:helix-turn-helix domain-containing protein [Pseudomonadota bacterium]